MQQNRKVEEHFSSVSFFIEKRKTPNRNDIFTGSFLDPFVMIHFQMRMQKAGDTPTQHLAISEEHQPTLTLAH